METNLGPSHQNMSPELHQESEHKPFLIQMTWPSLICYEENICYVTCFIINIILMSEITCGWTDRDTS